MTTTCEHLPASFRYTLTAHLLPFRAASDANESIWWHIACCATMPGHDAMRAWGQV